MSSDYSLDELKLENTLGGQGKLTSKRTLPIISLADFESRKLEIADQLWKAATEIGFFQIAEHGLENDDIDRAFIETESFFALPNSLKEAYPLKGGGLNAGWEYRAQVRPSTGTADEKESYQVTKPHMEGLWPSDTQLPGFKRFIESFEYQCWSLGMKVLSCFALKLGFDEDFFTQRHDQDGEGYQSTLRMLHYFPLAENAVAKNVWRAGAHTDFDCLTLLFQREGQDGLQVCPGKEADSGEWTEVTASNYLVTCNIGDMLMRWSDDKLKSTLHRVAVPENASGSRYSIAFFCQANKSALIEGPLKTYEPITAEDYLKQRIAANFNY